MTYVPCNFIAHQRLSLELALKREVKMTWLANTAEDLSEDERGIYSTQIASY